LFESFVVALPNLEEAATHMHEYDVAGFRGAAVCSGDAVHITMKKC
jgi:hypothetical protein